MAFKDESKIPKATSIEIGEYALLTKREAKMTGYWPSSFLYFFDEERSIITQKRTRPIKATLIKQAWSIKDLFAWWTPSQYTAISIKVVA